MASSKSADSDRPHAAELAYLTIAAAYPENESGTSLKRPELFRLLSDCKPGDILLIEQVDRLSRLTAQDWEKLKREIKNREVKVIALDLPTSHAMVRNEDQVHRAGLRTPPRRAAGARPVEWTPGGFPAFCQTRAGGRNGSNCGGQRQLGLVAAADLD